MVHVGCHVFCYILPNLTSDVVLGIDWLHAIKPQIGWHTYSLFMNCGVYIVHILGI